eukprot:7594872-Pyramimonas_sp.AAC.1
MNCGTFKNRSSCSRLPPIPLRNEAPASDLLRLHSEMTLPLKISPISVQEWPSRLGPHRIRIR